MFMDLADRPPIQAGREAAAEFVDCAQCPLRTKPLFRQMTDAEIQFVRGLKSNHINIDAHTHIVRAGENGHRLYTLFSGWAFRYRMRGKTRRQVLDFLLPGDLLGVQSPMS